MADLSRRQFLTRASAGVAASVAAASGLAAVPALLAPAVADAAAVGSAGSEPELDLASAPQNVVAYITNAKAGEVTVLVGTQQVVARDHQLADRMLRAARGATQGG